MRLSQHPKLEIRIFFNSQSKKFIQNYNVQTINKLLVIINEMLNTIHVEINLSVCFIAVFNPTKSQIRTKILKPRGFTPRTDKAPLQVPENLKIVQDELRGKQNCDTIFLNIFHNQFKWFKRSFLS